jgi:beta-glucosidase
MFPILPEAVKGTIAVMGPLANELRLDWYTGNPAYSVTPLDGLKAKYGNKVIYTDCRDIVSFTAEDGRPIILIDMPVKTESVKNDDTPAKEAKPVKKALAPGNMGDKPARFYMEDWGWSVSTFTDVETGLMLEGCYAREAIPAPAQAGAPVPPAALAKAAASYDDSEVSITATAKSNLQWFGFTLFNIIPQGNENVIIRTHDGRRVAALETGKPVKQYDNPLLTKGELFKMKIEHEGITAAVEAASKAEQIIFFAGNDPMVNGREEIDRPSLNLPPRQEELINAVTGVNPRTALVIISGYPYTIGETAKKIPAIIWMAHGIAETGNGVADVISGAYSPAGRLPLTWYESEKQLPDIMEYDIVKGGTTYQYFTGKVLWPFGHGLSYSSFEYSELSVDKTRAGENETVSVAFKIKNTGAINAEEVPQMYVNITGSNYKRQIKSLKGFERIMLKAGEEQTVKFELQVNELAIWENYSARMWLETCYCSIMIGTSSENIKLTGGFEVNGEKFTPRKITGAIYAERFDDYENCYLHEKRGSAIAAVFGKQDGSWIKFSSMDFEKGFTRFGVTAQGTTSSRIEVHADSPGGALIGTLEIPNTGDISFYHLVKTSYRRLPVWGRAETSLEKITGVRDIYFVLYGKTALWSFEFY